MRSETGSAPAALLMWVSVSVLALTLILGVGRVAHAASMAQAAADLAALAASDSLQVGGDACGTAARVTAAGPARLTDCRIEGREVVVHTSLALTIPLLPGSEVRARARAGPEGE